MKFNLRFDVGDKLYLIHDDYQKIETVTVERITLKYVDFLENGEQKNYDWRNDNPYLRYRISHHFNTKNGRSKILYFKETNENELEIRSIEEGYHLFVNLSSAERYLAKK